MASCRNHYLGISGHSRNAIESVFWCITVSNESEDNIYITWAKCGIASLVGATHCSCFKWKCGVASQVGATHCSCSKPSGGIDW